MRSLTIVIKELREWITIDVKEKYELIIEENFNIALEKVKTDYVIFVNENDTLDIDVLDKMILQIDQSNAELVMGNIFRLDCMQKWGRKSLFEVDRNNINIFNNKELIYENTLSNKLYKVEFLRGNQVQFNNEVYTESFFAEKTILLAEKICINSGTLVYWKPRRVIKGKRVNRLTLDKLYSRIQSNRELEGLYDKLPKVIHLEKQKRMIQRDLLVFLNDVLYADVEYQHEVLKVVRNYVVNVEKQVFKTLKSIEKLKYYMLKNEMYEELIGLIRFQKEQFFVSTWTEGEAVYADYPYCLNPSRNIPLDIYEVTEEIEAKACIEYCEGTQNKVTLKGIAYLDGVSCTNKVYTGVLILECKSQANNQIYELEFKDIGERINNRGNGLDIYKNIGFEQEVEMKGLEDQVIYVELKWGKVKRKIYVGELVYDHKNAEWVYSVDNTKKESVYIYTNNQMNYESALISQIDMVNRNQVKVDVKYCMNMDYMDEETYIILNPCLINQGTGEIWRQGVEKLASLEKLKDRLIFIINPHKVDSGFWNLAISIRENEGYEKIIQLNTLYNIEARDRGKKLNYTLRKVIHKGEIKLEFIIINNTFKDKLKKLENKIKAMENKIKAMENSKSWKLTRIFRIIGKKVKDALK